MSRIYVEPAVLLSSSAPAGARDDRESGRVAPHALEAVTNLQEAGHEVVLLVDPGRPRERGSDPRWLADLPSEAGPPTPRSWLVTVDPRRCEHRPPGVRTILIGPRQPPGPRPTAHCDVVARDLAAAVLEILAREAMS